MSQIDETSAPMTSDTTHSDVTHLDVTRFDVILVGGGMVGAATAIGLAQQGLQVAVIESFAPEAYQAEQPLDVRVSAISVASETLLERLGALDSLLKMRNVPYLGLETWELDGCITQFHSSQIGASHLGHIVENRLIQLALWQQMTQLAGITLYCPDKVVAFARDSDGVSVHLQSNSKLNAKLLVGADGAHSQVRQWAGIGISGWDYAQSAMLININTAQGQQDVTWQQFTPKGPRSLLPLPGNNASLVWYDDANRIKQLMQLNNKQLAEQIRLHFPARLRLDADFTVENKGSFGLTRRHAQRYYSQNVVILGDAAHTINPLAGQGVNLGFKDVEAFLAVIKDALAQDNIWWSNEVLAQYQRKRYRDNQLMMTAMDLFYAGFSNDILPLKLLRNGALKLANINSPIKKTVLKYAMGLN